MIHIAFGLLLGLALGALGYGGHEVLSFNIGLLFSALIASTMSLVLKMMIFKKSFALPIGVIVFKYAFLGIISYMVAATGNFNLALSAVGIFMIVPSALVTGIYYSHRTKNLKAEE